MRIVRSSFMWQFAGGFVLGAIGLVALQPAEATQLLAQRVAGIAHVVN